MIEVTDGGYYKGLGRKEAIGKTVKAMEWDCNLLIIVFTDGTFVRFEASKDWEGSPEIDLEEDGVIDDDQYVLRDAGVITEQERLALEQKKRTIDAAANAVRERQQYLALKAKYGDAK